MIGGIQVSPSIALFPPFTGRAVSHTGYKVVGDAHQPTKKRVPSFMKPSVVIFLYNNIIINNNKSCFCCCLECSVH
jgi:hypothetical protein